MSKEKPKPLGEPEKPEGTEETGLMTFEDLKELEREEREETEAHGIIPPHDSGADEDEDDMPKSGQFEPYPARAGAEAQAEQDDPTDGLLRAALEATTTATPAPLTMPAPKHPDAFASVDPRAATGIPPGARTRFFEAFGRRRETAATPTGFTQEGGEVHKLPMRSEKPPTSWLRPLGAGMALGAAGLTIAAGGLVAVKNGFFDKEEVKTMPVPSLSETIGRDIIVSQPKPEPKVITPEEQELLTALKSSHDGILVVTCGEKPGQLSLNEEVLLYPKGEPESAWTGVQWEKPWEKIQGFDAFPKALRDFCEEANAGKKAVIALSKPSQ